MFATRVFSTLKHVSNDSGVVCGAISVDNIEPFTVDQGEENFPDFFDSLPTFINIMSRQNSLMSRQTSLMNISRQNSLEFISDDLWVAPPSLSQQKPWIFTDEAEHTKMRTTPTNVCKTNGSSCFCDTDECKQRYTRHPKHPRILEPSTKLTKPDFYCYHGQIRMPEKLQQHIGHGSCKKNYKALITLLTYIQLNSGFIPVPSLKQKFVNPTEAEYCEASAILASFNLTGSFFCNEWVPTFQKRFLEACRGKEHVQHLTQKFLSRNVKNKSLI